MKIELIYRPDIADTGWTVRVIAEDKCEAWVPISDWTHMPNLLKAIQKASHNHEPGS